MSLRRLAAAAAFGLLLNGPAQAQETAGAALPAITVDAVEPATLTDRAYVSGLIAPVERVEVQPEIEGQAITEIHAEVGDRVTAGQVLARLSETALTLQRGQSAASRASAEATIAQARAQLSEAEALRDEAVRSRDRAATLAAQGSTTQAAAEDAAAEAAAASARVNAAVQAVTAAEAQLRLVEAQAADVELQLRRTAITAPVSGEILERNAIVGAIASAAGDPLFAIMRDGALELRADVAESDILRLAPGQKVRMQVAGLSAPLAGTVRLVEPTVDQSETVRSGMFAAAEVVVQTRTGLAVPISAIGGGAEGATALRVRDGVVSQVPVTLGVRDGDRVEVLDGLSEGDLVVAKAGAFVRDGDRINPVLADPAAAATN